MAHIARVRCVGCVPSPCARLPRMEPVMRTSRFPILLAVPASLATAFALLAPAPRAEVPAGPPTFGDPLTFTNEFFPFEPGAFKLYRGKSEGVKTAVVDVFEDDTRDFDWGGGTVETRLLREVEFEGGELSEISSNWFAQADDGSVYYFGETVDIYEDGEIVSHEGSWLVGGPTEPGDPDETATADDPGLIMPANPEVGDTFKPEDLAPIVDETVEVLSLDETMKVEAGKFTDVMKVEETSVLSEGSETKWHARGVGVIKTKEKGENLKLIASTLQPPAEE
jgi:hypothetical protein